MNYVKYLLLLSLSMTGLSATIYEDGQSDVDSWIIYDNKPAGASIQNIFDESRQSRVIEFRGAGRANAYVIGARSGEKSWHNSDEKILSWSMKFSEKFKLSVYLMSENGHRTLYYDYKDSDKGRFNNKYILMGLGLESKNGKWMNFSRNLEDDLAKYDEGNKILFINGFKVQGSGYIDDLQLLKKQNDNNIKKNNGEIVRAPYLQQGSAHSIIIRWRTAIKSDSRVIYGTNLSQLTLSKSNVNSTIEHEVRLNNLEANTKYYYRVGNSQTVFEFNHETSFKTSSEENASAPSRVWVLGDSGSTSEASKDVYTAYKNFTKEKETDLVLMLGDNAYKNGTDQEYQKAVFEKYTDILSRSPLWSVYGNHDSLSPNVYFNTFNFPTNAELGGIASHTENYYSFNHENIHFVMLDSAKSDLKSSGKMLKWLEEDLKVNHSKWLVAVWHHPPYTKGSYDSDKIRRMTTIRENFLPILEKNGVDLVLSGHSHVYERSKFIHGHYGKSSTFNETYIVQDGDGNINGDGAYIKATKEGTIYMVLGNSGSVKKDALLNHPIMVRQSKGTLGSVIIDTTEKYMDVKYLTNQGTIQDTFRIQK